MSWKPSQKVDVGSHPCDGDVRLDDLAALPYDEATVDAIIAADVGLAPCSGPGAVFREVRRVYTLGPRAR